MILLVPIASIVALLAALFFFLWILKQDVGNEDIVRISGYIRVGAMAYLRRQYQTVGIFFTVVFVILLYVAFGLKVLSGFVPFAFITGGIFSGLCGFLGMAASTRTANRTTNAARSSQWSIENFLSWWKHHGISCGGFWFAGYHCLVCSSECLDRIIAL